MIILFKKMKQAADKLAYLLTLFVVIASLAMTGCSGKSYYAEVRSWSEVVQLAQKKGKPIMLHITTNGCSACNSFQQEMAEDTDLGDKIADSYRLVKYPVDADSDPWILRTVCYTAYPAFLYFNDSLELQGVRFGYPNKEIITGTIDRIAKGETVLDSAILKKINRVVAPQTLARAFSQVMKAHYYQERYAHTADSTDLKKEEEELLQSIASYPYVYNQYLLASLYDTTHVKPEQKMFFATRALEDCEANKLYTFYDLRRELKRFINPTYSPHDDPYLELKTTELNAGILRVGDTSSLHLTITNAGKQPLEIQRINIDCSCLVAAYPEEPVAPGEKAEFHFVYHAKDTGAFTRHARILSNAINGPTFLTISATVKK